MKTSTRYTALLVAGVAEVGVGVYGIVLAILQESWLIAVAGLVLFTGAYLTARCLAALMYVRRGKPVPVLLDERTKPILHRAGWNAFAFLAAALPVAVGLGPWLSTLGVLLTWKTVAFVMLMVWVAAVLIFEVSFFYYNRTWR